MAGDLLDRPYTHTHTHTQQQFLKNIEMLLLVTFSNFIKVLKSTLFSLSLHHDF